jgi:hypothetical protein
MIFGAAKQIQKQFTSVHLYLKIKQAHWDQRGTNPQNRLLNLKLMSSTEISTDMKITSTVQMKAVGSSEILVTTHLKHNKTINIIMLIRIFPVFTRTEGSGSYSQN